MFLTELLSIGRDALTLLATGLLGTGETVVFGLKTSWFDIKGKCGAAPLLAKLVDVGLTLNSISTSITNWLVLCAGWIVVVADGIMLHNGFIVASANGLTKLETDLFVVAADGWLMSPTDNLGVGKDGWIMLTYLLVVVTNGWIGAVADDLTLHTGFIAVTADGSMLQDD